MEARGVFAAAAFVLASLGGQAQGTVQATGAMAAPRSEHTATFLGTGKVLVAGGTNAGGRLATAELYDPATGAFAAADSMPEARNGHAATLLPNGKVLVVGGSDSSGALATCRLYDPRTGAWASTGSMATARREHTATLLLNGKVLVAGGQNGSTLSPTALSSAELYDPATGTWAATGALGSARAGHAAALLEDGKVLVAGGQTKWFPLPALYTATAYVYDPGTGTWSVTGLMATARRSFTLTRIPGGLVVAAGGRNASGLSSAERYNVSNGAWGSAGDLGAARSGHAAALLPDARVLLVGGSDGTGPVGTMTEYSPGTNAWATVETGGARADHTATLLPGGRVLVVGGERTGWLQDAEIVDRASASWTAAPWGFGRVDGTATPLPNGKVLVVGNSPFRPAGGSLFDPVSDTWTYTAGKMIVPRSNHTATLLPGGDVLIVGGREMETGEPARADEVYDPETDSFGELAFKLPVDDRKSFHQAVLLADGRVLVGDGEPDGIFKPFVRDPWNTAWTEVPDPPVIRSPGRVRMTLLANGKVLVTSPDPEVWVFDPGPGGGWRLAARKEYRPNGHQALLLPSGDVLLCYQDSGAPFDLFDVESETIGNPWPWLSAPPGATDGFTATVLPDGRVLRVGGKVLGGPTLAIAQLFDPATGTVTELPPMAEARLSPEVALLADGRVLVAGGFYDYDTYSIRPSSEVLRLWPGTAASSRPVVSSIPSSLAQPGSFTLEGTGFRGVAEATGGNGSASSSAGVPSLLLRRLDGGLARWVPSAPGSAWSATSFPSDVLSGLPGGHYAATLFASGIASVSRAVPLTACEPDTGVLASTPAASVCEGQPLVLSARDVPGATFWWTLPDGSTSSGRVLTIPGAQQEDGGLYTVVAKRDGCTSPPDSVFVEVAPVSRMPVITAPSELGGNEDARASVDLHAGSTYAWNLSAGTILSGQGTSAIRFRAPGTGTSMTVTLVETVGASCVQPTAQKTISLSPCSVPTPTATNTGPYCTGDTIELTTPEVPGATAYKWEGQGGWTSSDRSPTIPQSSTYDAGTYTVRVQVGSCWSAPGSTAVVVRPVPPAPAPSSNTPVCSGRTISLGASTVTGATYSWTGPNGFSSTLQTLTIPNATTAMSGTYSVTATVNGCTSSAATTSVTVTAAVPSPTAGSNSPVAPGATITLTASTVAGATYSWTGPNGFTSTQQNPTIPNAGAQHAGTYSVTATVAGCTSAAGTTVVEVGADGTLTVVRLGSGAGSVASSPAGISCGTACSAPFPAATLVTLTATADAGSRFAGWAGAGCLGTGSCTVTISGAKTVTATFLPTASNRFYSVTPCRVVDTRNPAGTLGGPALAAGATRSFALGGACNVPSDAAAVSLNVTVADATAPGSLTLYPGTGPAPGTNTITFVPGKNRANNVTLGLIAGALSVLDTQTTGTVNLIIDVNGYYR